LVTSDLTKAPLLSQVLPASCRCLWYNHFDGGNHQLDIIKSKAAGKKWDAALTICKRLTGELLQGQSYKGVDTLIAIVAGARQGTGGLKKLDDAARRLGTTSYAELSISLQEYVASLCADELEYAKDLDEFNKMKSVYEAFYGPGVASHHPRMQPMLQTFDSTKSGKKLSAIWLGVTFFLTIICPSACP